MRNRLARQIEHHHAVEIFRFAAQLEYFPAADVGRLRIESAVAAPAAPQVAVPVDFETVERALIGRVAPRW